MLTQISWHSFFVTIILMLVVYYALILTLFYKHEIALLISGAGLHSSSKNEPIPVHLQQELSPVEMQPEEMQHLMDEVIALIQQAAYSRFSEDVTKEALQKLIASERFQSMRLSGHSATISELIIRECEANCSMHLNEEDLQGLWISERD